jgi:hypothetical protein
MYLRSFSSSAPQAAPLRGWREETMGKFLFGVFIGIVIGAYLFRDRALLPIML